LDHVAGWGSLALGYDFSNVRIYNAVFGGGTERSCIRLYGLSDVLVDGFSATGGTQFVQCWAGATNYNVTLKNGTYSGTKLLDQTSGKINNLVVSNVTQGVTTTTSTTAFQQTTTTRAPTTTSTTSTTSTTAPIPPSTTTTVRQPRAVTPSPYILIRNPGRWSTVSRGLVPVRAIVSSAQRVAKVICYVDGKRIGMDYRAPYSFVWNSRKAAPASVHTLTIVAYNKYGTVISRASRMVVVASR
jgi:hypothetical protein